MNLCVDQLHQLLQQLFSGNPGIENTSNVFNIWLKGPWRGTQVAKKVCDCISQSWFAVIGIAVIIVSGVLYKDWKKNMKIQRKIQQ